jgi:alanine racemase
MPSTPATSRAWAEVDLGAIARNLRAVRERAGKGVQVCAVVKADAYGHGAPHVARRALADPEWGAERVAVADVREGIELRQAGISAPVLLLGALLGSVAGFYGLYKALMEEQKKDREKRGR